MKSILSLGFFFFPIIHAISFSAKTVGECYLPGVTSIRAVDGMVVAVTGDSFSSGVGTFLVSNYSLVNNKFRWYPKQVKWPVHIACGAGTIQLEIFMKAPPVNTNPFGSTPGAASLSQYLYVVTGCSTGLDVLEVSKLNIETGRSPTMVFSDDIKVNSLVIDYNHNILYAMSDTTIARYNITDPRSISLISKQYLPLSSLQISPSGRSSLSVKNSSLYVANYAGDSAVGVSRFETIGIDIKEDKRFLEGFGKYKSVLVDETVEETIMVGRKSGSSNKNVFLYNVQTSAVSTSSGSVLDSKYSQNTDINSMKFEFNHKFVAMSADPKGILYVHQKEPWIQTYLDLGSSIYDFCHSGNILFACSRSAANCRIFLLSVTGVSEPGNFFESNPKTKYTLKNTLVFNDTTYRTIRFEKPAVVIDESFLHVYDITNTYFEFAPITYTVLSIIQVTLQKQINGYWRTIKVGDSFTQQDVVNEYLRVIVCYECGKRAGAIQLKASNGLGGEVPFIHLMTDEHDIIFDKSAENDDGAIWQPYKKKSLTKSETAEIVVGCIILALIVVVGTFAYIKVKSARIRLTNSQEKLNNGTEEDEQLSVKAFPVTVAGRESLARFSSGLARITKPAPSFEATALINDSFEKIKLSDYNGKWVLLFFYPLDFTFVCPTEIISYSKAASEFKKLNCQVLGASVDSHFSHLAWTQGNLGKLNIPLISDLNKQISKDYGVLLEDEGIALRGNFLIDPKGILRQVTINDLPVGRSVAESIRLLKAFQFAEKHGEVCPANWKEGDDTIKPDPEGSKEFFEKFNKTI